MEEIVERNTETQKALLKQRRSSILKMPKSRSPFGEIDLAEAGVDTTPAKSVRRVSFASSNFVKPFVADPDKNTIWDTTYEEEINHTDSTQSSQEQSNRINSTFLNSLKSTPNLTNLSVFDMELTRGTLLADKENVLAYPRKISIVDYAKQLSSNLVVPVFNLPSHTNVVNETQLETHTMEFTCQNINPFLKETDAEIAGHKDVMPKRMSLFNEEEKTNKSSDMDFTCQIPLSKTEQVCLGDNLSKTQKSFVSDKEFTCQTLLQKAEQDSQGNKSSKAEKSFASEMEFTCKIPLEQISDNCQAGTVNHRHKSSKIEKSFASEMELTCQTLLSELKRDSDSRQIPKTEIPNAACQNNQVSKTEKSFASDMEFTCQIPLQRTERISHSNKSLKAEKTSDEMEFTCQIPLSKTEQVYLNDNLTKTEKSFASDMEFTCQIPLRRSERISRTNKSLKAEKTSDEMEFTCQIPLSKTEQVYLNDNLTKTEKSFASDMEFTCQMPLQRSERISHSNKSLKMEKTSDEMEFTCQIPLSKTEEVCLNDNLSKTEKSFSSNMELTCQIPLLSQSNKSLKAEKASDEMKFTCQIPLSKTEQNHELSCVGQMEVTSQTTSSKLEQVSDSQIPKGKTPNAICQNNGASKTEQSFMTDIENMCQVPVSKTKQASQSQKTPSKLGLISNSCQIPRIENDQVSKTEKSFLGQIPINGELSKIVQFSENMPLCDCEMSETEKSLANDMEFTVQVPEVDFSESEMDVTCQNDKTEKDVDNEMEVTCQTLQNDKLSKTEDMKTACQIPITSSAGNEMEITHVPLSKMTLTNMKVTGNITKNEDLTVSCQVPSERQFFTMEKPETGGSCQNSHSRIKPSMNVDYRSPKIISIAETGTKSPSRASKIPVKYPDKRNFTINHTTEAENRNFEESKLDLTCTSSINEECKSMSTLRVQKTAPQSKHNASYFKTPEPSFHINLTNISPGVDDTQHLIHCTYTKSNPESFMTPKSMIKEGYSVTLEDTGHVTKPNLSSVSSDLEIEEDVDIQRNKLATVNDTYVLKGKNTFKCIPDGLTNCASVKVGNTYFVNPEETNDSDLGILDLEELSVGDEMTWSSFNRPKEFTKLKEYNLTIKRYEGLPGLIESIEKQRTQIREFLENFKFNPIQIPKEFTIIEPSTREENENITESKVTAENDPTIEEKIKKRQESSQNAWQLERVDDENYHFSTLFGTLIFIVELNPVCGRVLRIEKRNELADDSEPIALYIMKLFLDKFNDCQIKSAIGEGYDVLSLLDYVQMTMLKLISLQEDLIGCDIVTLSRDFIAKFTVLDMTLTLWCEISLDVKDLENVNYEDITICTRIGTVNEDEIRNLVKSCPKGYDFFKGFVGIIEEYLRIKEKRKRFEKSNL